MGEEERSIEEQIEIYRHFIKMFVSEIDNVQDLKRIYSIARSKYEKAA